MSVFESFFVMFWNYLPWLAIATMGGWAWRTRKESKALMLQVGGAAGTLALGVARWVILDLMLVKLFGAGPSVTNPVGYILGFLLFVALATFATGYCIERFASRKPAVVTATPA